MPYAKPLSTYLTDDMLDCIRRADRIILPPKRGRPFTQEGHIAPIGQYLAAWRKLHGGMSQSEMAEKMHMNQSTLSCIERGHRRPSQDTLLKIAAMTGDSLPDLYRAAGLFDPEHH